MKTAYVVVDLGFGDAGKGSITDYLANTRDIQAIIRYTGGPHAAHHVVRSDGMSHAFCQFGATFKPGVLSHLAGGMIVKPENLMYEGQALESKGVKDPFARLTIDPNCQVVTSYHAMLGQMKEVARGSHRYGTVGIGVGEAVLDGETNPDTVLRIADLYQPKLLEEKLLSHFESKRQQACEILRNHSENPLIEEIRGIYESFLEQVPLERILSLYLHFTKTVSVTLCPDADFMKRILSQSADVIFEGAHATLLDRDHGYFPYVAKTDTTARKAVNILEGTGFDGHTMILGAVRALGYRHGPGPFVTEDALLSGLFTEKHNKSNEWQGNTRYGWFDLLAVRQAVQINPRVDALALTMLDHLSQIGSFKVCLSYEYRGRDYEYLDEYFEFTTMLSGRVKITGIKPVPNRRMDVLSRLLFDCIPWEWLYFDGQDGIDGFIRFLESSDGLGLPVQIVSNGPAAQNKTER